MGKQNTYSCSQCGSSVKITEGVIERTCDHTTSGILASISAHAVGIGSLQRK